MTAKITKTQNTIHVHCPWAHDEVYGRAIVWMKDYYDKNPIKIDPAYGISYINGKIYIHEFGFICDEDKLAFMLTFPEIC
jgi:hypothetical protein